MSENQTAGAQKEYSTQRFHPEWLDSPADPFVEAMYEAEGRPAKAAQAQLAIAADPGCIQARLLLAYYSDDPETKIHHLAVAVKRGDELWTDIIERKGYDVTWWGKYQTRPYMEAIFALGSAYAEAGNDDAARFCFERLLTMNRSDNQGARHALEHLAEAEAPMMRM